jgi:hypothetical protein
VKYHSANIRALEVGISQIATDKAHTFKFHRPEIGIPTIRVGKQKISAGTRFQGHAQQF